MSFYPRLLTTPCSALESILPQKEHHGPSTVLRRKHRQRRNHDPKLLIFLKKQQGVLERNRKSCSIQGLYTLIALKPQTVVSLSAFFGHSHNVDTFVKGTINFNICLRMCHLLTQRILVLLKPQGRKACSWQRRTSIQSFCKRGRTGGHTVYEERRRKPVKEEFIPSLAFSVHARTNASKALKLHDRACSNTR
jgi:hypothetical protein